MKPLVLYISFLFFVLLAGQMELIAQENMVIEAEEEWEDYEVVPKFTVSGYVRDRQNGEDLTGATVYSSLHDIGAITNNYGFYSLSFDSGQTVNLTYSFVGYKTVRKRVVIDSNVHVNIDISYEIQEEGVDVEAEKVDKIQEQSSMSNIKLPMYQIESVPSLGGEVDVAKVMQLFPGVQSGNEASSGLYVRGGDAGQNLMTVDGVPVYNTSHLFGFFSVFNPSTVKHVELRKGAFPARYGGRSSSVLDIRLKEGNTKRFSGEGAIGLVSSKLQIEGPLWYEQTSFLLSMRRTYVDLLSMPVMAYYNSLDQDVRDENYSSNATLAYYFYDINAKVNHKFSESDRLYFSLYTGNDNLEIGNEELYDGTAVQYTEKRDREISWGSMNGSLRWNHRYGHKLFSNTILAYTDYKFVAFDKRFSEGVSGLNSYSDFVRFNYVSGVKDYVVINNWDFVPNNAHLIKFGAEAFNHDFRPGINTTSTFHDEASVTNLDSNIVNAMEGAIYFEDNVKVNDKIRLNGGFRFSGIMVDGANYFAFEPRLSLRILTGRDWALKSGYARMTQYLHMLSNSTLGMPTDLYVPVTNEVRPQLSDQYTIGLAKTINGEYLFSIESYQKTMKDLITYKEGYDLLTSGDNWEDRVVIGNGYSKGLEVLLQKKVGVVSGWISYTYSTTTRQFNGLNNGNAFPFENDRRHDFSLVYIKKLSDNWEFSSNLIFGTGNAMNLPNVRYSGLGDGKQDYEVYFTDRKNNFRAAPYHRWDVSFKHFRQRRWGTGVMTYSLYNVYNRNNPFYYFYGETDRGARTLKRVGLFPIIPTISWTFKFGQN